MLVKEEIFNKKLRKYIKQNHTWGKADSIIKTFATLIIFLGSICVIIVNNTDTLLSKTDMKTAENINYFTLIKK